MSRKFHQTPPSRSKSVLQSAQTQVLLEQAIAWHQKGDLLKAKAIYEKVLKAQPKNFDALHLLGLIAYQSGNFLLSVQLISQAIEINPTSPIPYSNIGLALKELKQFKAAVESYKRAIALKPDYAEAHNNLGVALQELKQFDAAVESFQKAVAIKPDYAEAFFNCSVALLALQQFGAVVQKCRQAITIKPDYAEAYNNLGQAQQALCQISDAIESYGRALAIKPGFSGAHNNLGTALYKIDRIESALEHYSKAITIKADYAEAYNNRSVALFSLKQFESAAQDCRKAISVKPDYAEAYNNLAVALHALKHFDAAIDNYNKAIAFKPDYVDAYCNLGITLQEIKRIDAAIDVYNRAITDYPHHVKAHWNLSLALLLLGRFDEGWPLYEWRWKTEEFVNNLRSFDQPLWLGKESLHGKTILLYSEQGLGDTIQFCRYAKLVSSLGARVVLEVPRELMGLLRHLDGIDALVEKSATPLPAFDVQCPLLSLPLAFNTRLESIPSGQSYLRSDPDKVSHWRNILGEKTKPFVGLVWSGSTGHKNDKNRSITLSQLLPYLPHHCDYVSLQKDLRDVDKAVLESQSPIRHYGELLNDFTDTAALCDVMDIIVTVDTSIAHLSAALGKKTLILLPYVPDWRWLLDRTDSPWYPTAQLYRQQAIGNWENTFQQLHSTLNQLLATS